MTPDQAKHLLPIIKAYSEGKTIQIQSVDDKLIWTDLAWPHFVGDVKRYRIKPDPIVVKYRRFIWRNEAQTHSVAVLHDRPWRDASVTYVETLPEFVRWIDTDWVTENV